MVLATVVLPVVLVVSAAGCNNVGNRLLEETEIYAAIGTVVNKPRMLAEIVVLTVFDYK